jgi:hypothetical protein
MTAKITRQQVATSAPEVGMRAGVWMRGIIAMLALIGTTTAGCLEVAPQPPLPATTMSSWGPAGGFTMSSGMTCAGQATLNAGHASVNDRCFTGVDNIVMCTDTTAPNAVQCSPGFGYLTISGAAGDTISYARMK